MKSQEKASLSSAASSSSAGAKVAHIPPVPPPPPSSAGRDRNTWRQGETGTAQESGSATWHGWSERSQQSWTRGSIVRQPPNLPKGDQRFAARKRDRKYICDGCGDKYELTTKAYPFDGQYVDVLAVRGRSPEEALRACWAGEINATWYCSWCHKRPDEHITDTRIRLDLVDNKRVERTKRLLAQGYHFPRCLPSK